MHLGCLEMNYSCSPGAAAPGGNRRLDAIRTGRSATPVSITDTMGIAIHHLIHPPLASAIWTLPRLASGENDSYGQQSKSKSASQHIEPLRNIIASHVGAGCRFCDGFSEFIGAFRPATGFGKHQISVDIGAR
jgi:hypothetical protein